jgi:Flp pilus assembly protein TadG
MRILHGLERRLSTLRRDERGASAVEFAIVCSIFIALCIAIVQFGLALQVRNDLAQAADRGARLIVLDPDATDEALETKVKAFLPSYDSASLVVDVGEEAVGSTDYRIVTITYQMQIAIPGFPLNVMTLNASRQVPVVS